MKKFIDKNEASKLTENLSNEFVFIKNPDFVHPEYEICPLAAKIDKPVEELKAIVMDMDGTTTTTEELCIHSLEFMIRKMSGKLSDSEWIGLDHIEDYPHIIGNSTTKHVEYLINKYNSLLNSEEIKRAFIYSAVWTLKIGKDLKRKDEVLLNLQNLNLSNILDDDFYKNLQTKDGVFLESEKSITYFFFSKYSQNFTSSTLTDLVKIGIDIYYQRYHEILEQIKNENSQQVSFDIFNDKDKHLIQPMPGVLIFLALIKGWLSEDFENIFEILISEYEIKSGLKFETSGKKQAKAKLVELSKIFAANPLKVAIVTSSIQYEADIVMKEVFKVLRADIDNLNISKKTRELLQNKFSDYRNVYNAFVTASDSNEIRLKPHRDLYSIALHQLNISKNDFDKVVGFEDSESGTISIRAAGIGICVAVPFAQTAGHNLDAATYICKSGLPEALLNYNLFIN